MLRIFYFFTTFGDGFSQVAQSFIPTVLYRNEKASKVDEASIQSSSAANSDGNDVCTYEFKATSTTNLDTSTANFESVEDKKKTKILLKKIIVLASMMAVINFTTSKAIMQRCSSLFTNDAIVQSIVSLPWNVFYVTGSVLIHPFLMAFEGTILAARDLGYLVSSYGFTMGAILLILRFRTSTFPQVWRSLFLFQVTRFVLLGWRVWQKTWNVKDDHKSSVDVEPIRGSQ